MTSTERPARSRVALISRSVRAASRAWAVGKVRDDQLLILETNPAFNELTGYSGERASGQPLEVLNGIRTDPAAVEEVRLSVKAGRSTNVTTLLYKRDGGTFWAEVSLSPIADEDGVARHYVAVFVDVTAHVLAQRDLEAVYESERVARQRQEQLSRRLQALLTEMPSAVIVVGAQSRRVLLVNDQAARVLGMDPTGMESMDNLLELPKWNTDGTGLEASRWPLERSITTGEVIVDEEMVVEVGGDRRVITMRSAPIYDADELLDAGVLVLDDITERRRAEMELAASRERAASLAHSLQQSLLPADLPSSDTLEFGAAFVPLGEGLEVGGDFYDVFEQRDGHFVAVIGDVMGKGVKAAAVTSLVRHVLRTTALRSRKVSTLLHMLNEALCREGDGHPFATVAATMFVPAVDGMSMTVGLAGHPSPFVVRANGDVEEVGRSGTLSGVVEEIEVHEEEVLLRSGDSVVLFTDGVTEARNPQRELLNGSGLSEILRSLSTEERSKAADIATAIERAVVKFSSAPLRDDLAVLVIRIT